MTAPAVLDGAERRILVVGSGGAGKSWLTTRLAAITGLPAVHLDVHYWNPGWKETPEPEWTETVARLTRGDRWVMDGNFSGTLRDRVEAADAIIFLDVPRRRCLAQLFGRLLRWYGRSRPDLPPGCPEGFDLAFLRWVWDFPKRTRPAVIAEMELAPARVKRITLRSKREVRAFLDACGAATRLGGAPGRA